MKVGKCSYQSAVFLWSSFFTTDVGGSAHLVNREWSLGVCAAELWSEAGPGYVRSRSCDPVGFGQEWAERIVLLLCSKLASVRFEVNIHHPHAPTYAVDTYQPRPSERWWTEKLSQRKQLLRMRRGDLNFYHERCVQNAMSTSGRAAFPVRLNFLLQKSVFIGVHFGMSWHSIAGSSFTSDFSFHRFESTNESCTTTDSAAKDRPLGLNMSDAEEEQLSSTNVKCRMLRTKNWKPHKTLLLRPLDLNSDKLCSEFKTKRL